MNPPSNQANLFIEWYRVKEDGVVQIMYLNIDPGNITPTAQDYNFAVFRKAT